MATIATKCKAEFPNLIYAQILSNGDNKLTAEKKMFRDKNIEFINNLVWV